MMRSLYSGVSGLKNHQTAMDVIGNNIANVNTTGFKASRVTFQDVLSQTIQGASSANGNIGGTNPMQVGLGMGVASIDTIFTDGSSQPTGKSTDLQIQGNGFFVITDGTNQLYTRAGGFDFDEQGNYVVPGTGYKVMGWLADANGNIDTNQPVAGIQIPVGLTMPAKASQSITFANNLSGDSSTAVGTTVQTAIDVYDSLGAAHTVTELFHKTAANTWVVSSSVTDATGTTTNTLKEIKFDSTGKVLSVKDASVPGSSGNIVVSGLTLDNDTVGATNSFNVVVTDGDMKTHTLTVTYTTASTTPTPATYTRQITDEDGNIISGPTTDTATALSADQAFTVNGTSFTLQTGTIAEAADSTVPTVTDPDAYTTTATNSTFTFTPDNGANPVSIANDYSKLTQYGGESTVKATGQDGYAAGTLNDQEINTAGIIVGKFSNGQSQNLGQVCLATFNNPAGLNKVGGNMFERSNNSGEPQVGTGGSGGRGSFNPGSLEMSNVDLAQEFSNMIVIQRGFQANSKIITVADDMLETLANLKR